MKLSDNLKSIRKENNLSQEQLAEKLGVSRQAVSKWESGQSYPEMDKVLMICKMFNYNIDELMNENIKEVNETKQARNNINKYIEDFFSFITKTVDMFMAMKFIQKIKCFLEQLFIILFLLVIFVIIGSIADSVLAGLIGFISFRVYHVIYNILRSLYIILALFVGIAILLHIFKIRYLDYYEIIQKGEDSNINEIEEKIDNNENKKIFIKKNKEKIIIRDSEHSQSKFLNGLIRIVLCCIKLIAILVAICFAVSFIVITTLVVLSFLFVKTGLIFFGSIIALLSALIINFVILELLYDFIVNKKSKKNRIAVMLLIALIFVGISIGLISIGITEFNYIKDSEKANTLEDNFTVQMTDNLSINNFNNHVKIKYIETDNNEIKITVKYSKYYNVNINEHNETINLDIFQTNTRIIEIIRDIIKDINNKEILDYHSPVIYVYASKDNIERIQQNQYTK